MNKRVLSLDLARGFTVFFIAPIHVMLLYSKPNVRETWTGEVFKFIAEGPGAQLLMMLLGISFCLSGKHSFLKTLLKIVGLLLIGYFLNFWKFALPTAMGIMPTNFMKELAIDTSNKGLIKSMLIGDILHFAAIAILVLYILKWLFKGHTVQFALAVLACILSICYWDMHSTNPYTNYILTLITGQPPQVFFPVLPWIVYPLIGYVIGSFIKDGSSLLPLLPLGIAISFIGFIISEFFFPCTEVSFYRTCPGHTILHTGVVLAWLGAWEFISLKIRHNKIFEFLQYLSRHITLIYFIQWIIISWLLTIVGYQTLDFSLTMIACVLVQVNVLGFAFIINEIRKPILFK